MREIFDASEDSVRVVPLGGSDAGEGVGLLNGIGIIR